MSEEEQIVVEVGIATETSAGVPAVVEDESVAIVPLIGLVVDLGQPKEVAVALSAVREAKRQLDAARAGLERVLVEESRVQGTKTLHFGDLTAKVSGGPEIVWDVEQLREDLTELELPEERINQLITETVTYKVNASVANQLAGANASYAEAISRAKSRVEKPYRVSVE